jgi:hypothetical protein
VQGAVDPIADEIAQEEHFEGLKRDGLAADDGVRAGHSQHHQDELDEKDADAGDAAIDEEVEEPISEVRAAGGGPAWLGAILRPEVLDEPEDGAENEGGDQEAENCLSSRLMRHGRSQAAEFGDGGGDAVPAASTAWTRPDRDIRGRVSRTLCQDAIS